MANYKKGEWKTRKPTPFCPSSRILADDKDFAKYCVARLVELTDGENVLREQLKQLKSQRQAYEEIIQSCGGREILAKTEGKE